MTEILGYKPAKLYKAGTRLYIGYYIVNPSTGKYIRKRSYVNYIEDPVVRNRYISDAIKKINEKLREGWNPLIDDQSGKMFTRFVEVLDEIFEYKKAILRQRSVHTYSSRVKTIKEWLDKIGKEKIWVYEFNGQMAGDFMDYLVKDKKVHGINYNNYIIDFRALFNGMVQKGYIKSNPFKTIVRLPEQTKFKQPFDRDQSETYVDYLKENDYDFFIISGYTYYCALRPNEIVQLRVKNINLEKQYIEVPAEIGKSRKQRRVVISDEFLQALEPYIKKYPSEYYICSYGFKPGKNHIYPTRIAEHFREIADRIGLPKEIFFYSLKDTCAERMMEAGYSAQDIRDLFGHSSIAITDNYLKRRNPYQNEKLKKNFPKL
ncbi:MAG: tyrosine-type recombinase/integrase [Bacteroidales bacterium]|nr:tyrosine-type recombinase/integrase [Bacteroidales bacterium]